MSYQEVSYTVFSSLHSIKKELKKLSVMPVLAFDVETRSLYNEEQVKEAKDLLKKPELIDPDDLIHVKQVARSSGLSHPSLIRTTHFQFSYEVESAVIFIAENELVEQLLWDWVAAFKHKLVVHNAMLEMKICYHRTRKFPGDYEDTMLLAKCYINNAETYKGKVGLKELMGNYYPPSWALYNDYNVKDLRDRKFLVYCSYDASSTFMLYKLLQEYIT